MKVLKTERLVAARQKHHPRWSDHGAIEPARYFSNVAVSRRSQISKLLIDNNGCLKIEELGAEIEKMEPITFSGHDICFQVHIKKGGKLFNAIKDELHKSPGLEFDVEDSNKMALVLAGSDYQKVHRAT